MAEEKLLYAELTHKIIGAAMDVHTILGPGFLEAVYEDALAHEFDLRGIAYERQKTFRVPYKLFFRSFLITRCQLAGRQAVRRPTLGYPRLAGCDVAEATRA